MLTEIGIFTGIVAGGHVLKHLDRQVVRAGNYWQKKQVPDFSTLTLTPEQEVTISNEVLSVVQYLKADLHIRHTDGSISARRIGRELVHLATDGVPSRASLPQVSVEACSVIRYHVQHSITFVGDPYAHVNERIIGNWFMDQYK